jgi:hypothetical protein
MTTVGIDRYASRNRLACPPLKFLFVRISLVHDLVLSQSLVTIWNDPKKFIGDSMLVEEYIVTFLGCRKGYIIWILNRVVARSIGCKERYLSGYATYTGSGPVLVPSIRAYLEDRIW